MGCLKPRQQIRSETRNNVHKVGEITEWYGHTLHMDNSKLSDSIKN